MISASTEIATPSGWRRISDAKGLAYGWGSPGGLPCRIEFEATPRRRPCLRLEARSGSVLETTPEHDLWIESQMTGSQIIPHGEIARRMRDSSSYKRKSIYSFPEAVPVGSELIYPKAMPKRYRDSAIRKVASGLPFLCAVGPYTVSIQLPHDHTSIALRKSLHRTFSGLGALVRMKGRPRAPIMQVELRGHGVAVPDIMLASVLNESLTELLMILVELGPQPEVAQNGWWHTISAFLGVRMVQKGGEMEVLRHRRHSLRCPAGVEQSKRACFDLKTKGIPLILTRNRLNGGLSAPVLVPVR